MRCWGGMWDDADTRANSGGIITTPQPRDEGTATADKTVLITLRGAVTVLEGCHQLI